MKYIDALEELDKIGLKENFIKEFEGYCNREVLEWLKVAELKKLTPKLIRDLLNKFNEDSKEFELWTSVWFYFMTPEFDRPKYFKTEKNV